VTSVKLPYIAIQLVRNFTGKWEVTSTSVSLPRRMHWVWTSRIVVARRRTRSQRRIIGARCALKLSRGKKQSRRRNRHFSRSQQKNHSRRRHRHPPFMILTDYDSDTPLSSSSSLNDDRLYFFPRYPQPFWGRKHRSKIYVTRPTTHAVFANSSICLSKTLHKTLKCFLWWIVTFGKPCFFWRRRRMLIWWAWCR
jgi:hypothetical protein